MRSLPSRTREPAFWGELRHCTDRRLSTSRMQEGGWPCVKRGSLATHQGCENCSGWHRRRPMNWPPKCGRHCSKEPEISGQRLRCWRVLATLRRRDDWPSRRGIMGVLVSWYTVRLRYAIGMKP